ncbi:hypothetical protein chiPu_0000204 [Chiloscyllium punctatum]|uniref:Kazal-like domain-containing protein n=1 Tax=Chiloscyllium punctatum TaxID=137246 RepID=A0A401RSF6_CHIPU|nr:hypothetical protein [Chiloscyllium punctatum]
MLGRLWSSPCPLRFSAASRCLCFIAVFALSRLPVVLLANPLSSAECQSGKGKGINCSEFNERENDFKMCDETTCKFGGVCKEIGDDLTCSCQFHCHTHYIPVCASNGDTYQNECFMRLAACKYQKEITAVTEGLCYTENGSGSGEGGMFISYYIFRYDSSETLQSAYNFLSNTYYISNPYDERQY